MPSSMPRINWIEIQGFRAFGKTTQHVDFTSKISVLWGPNSQGKTSFAEAVEFLFTGAIVRKELLASGQDEFADSLRNTHLPSSQPVFVAAEIVDGNGIAHTVRRTLASDFGKRASCSSTLEIDGKPGTSEDFAKISITLSQPPMSVPILMQHTLGYLFTAKPSERALYFKALLEVGDLDAMRNAISQRETVLQKADTDLIRKLRLAAAIANTDIQNSLRPLFAADDAFPSAEQAIANALNLLIWSAGLAAPVELDQKIKVVENLLESKQTRTFPLAQLVREPFATVAVEEESLNSSLGDYGVQAEAVDTELRELMSLFKEVLKIPAVVANVDAINCPVCGTEEALTRERVQVIRGRLEASQAFVNAQSNAQTSLRQLDTELSSIANNISRSRPKYRAMTRQQRRESGFSVERIRELLPEEQTEQIRKWLLELKSFLREMRRLRRMVLTLKEMAAQDVAVFADSQKVQELNTLLGKVREQQTRASACERAYGQAQHVLKGELQSIVDVKSSTIGWQELLDVAKDQQTLHADLVDMRAREIVKSELAKALRDIDRAKEEVMNDKFAGMSDEIKDWWEKLRPDEPVFFSGVKPRPQTVRTIDFKAGLSTTSERLNPHVRDVVAIFSMSQMHCLGLAAFLARSVREKCGFIILDDPILSSDEDYRTNFMHGALEALIADGFQIILLTQDQNLRKTLSHLYAHHNIDLFEITMNDPVEGSEVNKTSDSISAMLATVRPFIGNANLVMRKSASEKLRDIAERVCKEIIVNNRRTNGDATAAITDYTGPKGTLEYLISEAEPYLNDKGHPGKLKVIVQTLNPGKHDDKIPTKEALKQAFGDLGGFRRQYSLS